MGVSNHTPDPAAGAAIDAAGVIVLPDDNESAKADNIRLGDEQLADWVSYRTGGPAGNIEFKITGNGAPPVAGYTVVTRPVTIKGTQGFVFEAPLKSDNTYIRKRTTAIATTAVLTRDYEVYIVDNPAADVQLTLDEGGTTEVGDVIEVRAYNVDPSRSVDIRRQTGTPISIITIDEGDGGCSFRWDGTRWKGFSPWGEHLVIGGLG